MYPERFSEFLAKVWEESAASSTWVDVVSTALVRKLYGLCFLATDAGVRGGRLEQPAVRSSVCRPDAEGEKFTFGAKPRSHSQPSQTAATVHLEASLSPLTASSADLDWCTDTMSGLAPPVWSRTTSCAAPCASLSRRVSRVRLRNPTAKDLALAGVFLTCQPASVDLAKKGQIQKIKIFGTLMAIDERNRDLLASCRSRGAA